MNQYDVTLTLTEPLLGTVPKDPEVYATYVADNAPPDTDTADELGSVPVAEEKGWTGFHTVDGNPVLYDYVIKGFFKDACGMLRRLRHPRFAQPLHRICYEGGIESRLLCPSCARRESGGLDKSRKS